MHQFQWEGIGSAPTLDGAPLMTPRFTVDADVRDLVPVVTVELNPDVYLDLSTPIFDELVAERAPVHLGIAFSRLLDVERLIDPDCRDGKCQSCVGGACEHDCHKADA